MNTSNDDPTRMDELMNKRIIDMTGAELCSLLRYAIGNSSTSAPPARYVYGISGLARLLNCSDATAWRKKKSGILDEAIYQDGDIIIIDTLKVLEILKKHE